MEESLVNQLYCRQFNQGTSDYTPLVMLHGFLGDSTDWQAIATQLPKNISCYGIDLPGHGKSKNIVLDHNAGFAQCSEMIATTLAQQGISTYILLGYSLGGRIALYHASQKPQQVKGLILESCHWGLDDNKLKQQRLINDTIWADKFATQHLPNVLTSWYQQDVFNSLNAQQKKSLITMRSQLNGNAISNMLLATSLGKQENLAKKIVKTNIPSYYFFGEKDFKYQNIAIELQQIYSRLNTIKFYQSGHNIHFEQPESFVSKLKEVYSQLN